MLAAQTLRGQCPRDEKNVETAAVENRGDAIRILRGAQLQTFAIRGTQTRRGNVLQLNSHSVKSRSSFINNKCNLYIEKHVATMSPRRSVNILALM